MKSVLKFFAACGLTLPLFAADPAELVEENRRLEEEVRQLETEWQEQANANQLRERENRNLERVIAQQQALIAANKALPKGAVAPDSSAVKFESAAAETKIVFQQKFNESFHVSESFAKFAAIKRQEDGKPALEINWPAADGKTSPCILLPLKTDDIVGKRIKCTVLARAENISKPPLSHLGGKFGLRVPVNDGKTLWPGASIGGGSFEWKQVSFVAGIPYGAKSVALMLGLQGVTGKIQFRDLKVELAE